MFPATRCIGWPRLLAVVAAVAACADSPSRTLAPTTPRLDAVKFWEVTASTRWNRRANALLAARPPAANGVAAASRILTYLSIAQYRAVLAAEANKDQSTHPSVAAAVGGASVAVLSSFFPLDVTALETQLDADLAAPEWPGARNQDDPAGESLGRAIGAAALAQAATDNYLLTSPGVPPVGPGYWVSSAAPIVRSLHGVRPFFLASASQFRPGPPPAFGSAEFLDALAEIREISDTRTAEQISIAQTYANVTSPFTGGAQNLIADDLIVEHKRTEREAARILAYLNAASFDAQIACFDAKFAYWFIRPSQADPAITLPIPLPNHPSYPSGHACVTNSIMSVLIDAFPNERARLEEFSRISGLSRMYGGIHYRFDVEAGGLIGRQVAALALSRSLE